MDTSITCVLGEDNAVNCVVVCDEEVGEVIVLNEDTGEVLGTFVDGEAVGGETQFSFELPDGADDTTVQVACGSQVLGNVLERQNTDVIAATGADSATLLAIAGGAIAIGGLVLMTSRRGGNKVESADL